MNQFCIVFKSHEEYTHVFITRAYTKLEAIKKLIDTDNDGYLIDLINFGTHNSNTKGSSEQFKHFFYKMNVFDKDDELDISQYNIFKFIYKDQFAEYLKEWCKSCKEIRIEKIKEDIIM